MKKKSLAGWLGSADIVFNGNGVRTKFQNCLCYALGTIVMIATVVLGATLQAQAGTVFNLDVLCVTPPYAQGSVPASSSVDFYLTDIDISKNFTGEYMGNSTVEYQTTSGATSSTRGAFSLWTATTTLADKSVYAYFGTETADESLVSLNTIMPSGFSFDSVASYAEFFNTFNENGVYNPYTAACYVSSTCFAVPQTAIATPEPTSLALLSVAAVLGLRGKNLKRTHLIPSVHCPSCLAP